MNIFYLCKKNIPMHISRIFFFLLLSFALVSCKNDSALTKESTTTAKSAVESNKAIPANGLDGMKGGKKLNDMTTEELKEHFKDDPLMLKKLEEREKAGELNLGNEANGIPDPCSFVDAKYLARKLGASEGHIKQSQGKVSPSVANTSRSCFWRWNGAGMMIQISTNPMPEQVPNYISKSLNTKRSFGDSSLGGENSSKFVDFNGPGTINIKHEATSRYYVSKGDEYMIFIMFNGATKNYDKVVKEVTSDIIKKLN